MTPVDWGAAAVMTAPGFRDARSVVELGAGDFSRSMALAERYPTKRFLSTDYEFGAVAVENLPLVDQMANLTVDKLDARTIDLRPKSVDLIFSIALMEHVAELGQCLESIYRALRPGGVYFYIQAPFWTCAQGHHFRHHEDATYEFIPKYSHLTNSRDQFEAMLRGGKQPPFDIDACVDAIYSRPDLSRLGLVATKAIVEASPLELGAWIDKPDPRYDEAAARAAHPNLRVPAQFTELAVSGAQVVLRRPASPTQRAFAVTARQARKAARRARRLVRTRRT